MQKIQYPEVKIKDVALAFWQGIKPKKWHLFAMVFCVILANITIVIVPIFYKQFFDIISEGGQSTAMGGQLIQTIVYIAILNGVFWLFYRIAHLCNNGFIPAVMANLKHHAYGHLMNHSYSFFTNNFVGSLVQKVNRFSRAFENLSDNLVWNLLPLAVKVVAIFMVVFLVNKFIALVILIWALIFLLFNVIFSKWKLKYDIEAAQIDSKTTAYLADTITNQNTVQLFNKFPFEMEGYKNITGQQVKLTQFRWNLDLLIDGGQSFLSFAIEFLLFFFAIKYWQQGLITLGVFVLLQAYLITLIHQLWGFTRIVRDIYQGYADAKEMVEIMKLPHQITDAPLAKVLQVSQGEIEFKNLHFSFNETRKVLENINLVIKPGQRVALIGPSGAGKSTFIKLLLRLYVPDSGAIVIDGQDIAKVTQGSLRQNISLVPQDPVLFHRTLAENIAYGKPKATLAQIKKAAKLAHCDEFINNLPLGLQTLVGERGIKLSGGERQRVAIARAMVKNAPILILDEATSSLDSHSEMLIQDALGTLMAQKTTIVIAHRLSTIQKMDRIVVIDNGQIIEQGNHRELLAQEGSLYKKLWTLQAGGFLADDEVEEPVNEKEADDGQE